MKNQNLKLEFIENGRLSNGEMKGIVGGALKKCGVLTPCPHGEMNKSTCSTYKDCDSLFDKFSCGTFKNFAPGFNFTFDALENMWYAEPIA
jgi:hypothetical protein